MSDKTELLPCPFCGGDAASDAHAEDCYFSVVEAFKKKAMNNADMSLAPAVLRAWNRRAAIAKQPAPVAVPDGFKFNRLPYEALTSIELRENWSDSLERRDYAKRVAEAAMRSCEVQLRQMLAAAPAAPVAVRQSSVISAAIAQEGAEHE